MSATDQKLPYILNKTGLDVFLEEIKDDIKEIKETIKELPTNERITNLEDRVTSLEAQVKDKAGKERVESLERDRLWFVRIVVGAVLTAILGYVIVTGKIPM